MVVVHVTGSGESMRFYVIAGASDAGPGSLRAVIGADGRVVSAADDAPEEGIAAQTLTARGWAFLTPRGRVFASDSFTGRLRRLGVAPYGSVFKRASQGRAVLRAPGGSWLGTDGRAPLTSLRAPPGALDVAFGDASRGAAVVEGGALLRTSDAGTTWHRVDGPTAWSVAGRGGAVVVEAHGERWRLAGDGTLSACPLGCDEPSVEPGEPRRVLQFPLERSPGVDNRQVLDPRDDPPVPPALRHRHVEVIASPGVAPREPILRLDQVSAPVRIRGATCRLRAAGRSPLARPPAGVEAWRYVSLFTPVLWGRLADATRDRLSWSGQDPRGPFGVNVPRVTASDPRCATDFMNMLPWATRTGALATARGVCFVASTGEAALLNGEAALLGEGSPDVRTQRDGRAAVLMGALRRPWGDPRNGIGAYTVARRFVVDDHGRVSDDAEYVTHHTFGSLWVELPDGRSGPARFVGDPASLEALVYPEREPREILRVDGELDAPPCTSPTPAPDAITVHLTGDTYAGLEATATRTDAEGDTPPFTDDARAVVEMTARSACVRSITARGSSWYAPAGDGDLAVRVTAQSGALSGYGDSGTHLFAITCRARREE